MSNADDERAEFCIAEYPRLVGAVSLYTGDADMAVDVAQEALARACAHWSRVSRMAAPGAWVHRVAINEANSAARKRSRERHARDRAASAHPRHEELPIEAMADVRSALARLSDRQRKAVVLRYYLDLSARDAAYVMNCAEGTVRALTHQALTRMRIILDPPVRTEVSDAY